MQSQKGRWRVDARERLSFGEQRRRRQSDEGQTVCLSSNPDLLLAENAFKPQIASLSSLEARKATFLLALI
jgi:hypothetical protein